MSSHALVTTAPARTAEVQRNTAETRVRVRINLDGTGVARLNSGIGFLDHMLDQIARHGLIDLDVECAGDLHIDGHHTVEDIGITLGQAFAQAVGDKKGIRRYGHFTLPMEETLVTTAVDFSGRAYFAYQAEIPAEKIGQFDSELVFDFWQAFSTNAQCNLHILLHYGRNSHHVAEGIFKATARVLRMAVEPDPRITGIPSTKGAL